MKALIDLFIEWCGHEPAHIEPLPKAGSNRKYVRMYHADGQTVIGVIGPSIEENQCFVYLASHFTRKGLPTPRIYAFSDDETCYLQEDLGNLSLYQALEAGRRNNYLYSPAEVQLLSQTIRLLPHLQIKGGQDLEENYLLEPAVFNEQAALFDMHYFKYCFLKATDVPYNELRLEDDFKTLAKDLVGQEEGKHFLYRDFQARNVMLKQVCSEEGGAARLMPYFIDFQGGMRGPIYYDVASFLWQASARYSHELRMTLASDYLDELNKVAASMGYQPHDSDHFFNRLQLFVLFRTLQVLGAYGLRGYFEHKQYFLDSIPLAIHNLSELLVTPLLTPYPTLKTTLQTLVKHFNEHPRAEAPATAHSHTSTTEATPEPGKKLPLTVRIFSFSYKKGIPADTSGNGGGYVFDCRSTHNPGRYEPYKALTGLDAAVITFLEEDGEIVTFLKSVYKLADAHVERYIARGFTDLMFSFGCTGGQHRSVYSAQHLAEHLHQKYGIEIRLCHREQGISTTFPATGDH